MSYSDTSRLFDILARHAIVVESFKVYTDGFIGIEQAKLKTDLFDILSRIKYDTLDGLTKAELRALVVKLREMLQKHYSKYTADMLALFQQFMRADAYVQRAMMASLSVDDDDAADDLPDEDNDDIISSNKETQEQLILSLLAAFPTVSPSKLAGGANLWATINNSIMPADGQTIGQLLNTFSAGSINNILKIVQKAYVNGDSVKDVLNTIVGTAAAKFNDGEFIKQVRQASTVTHTIVQHVTSVVSATIQSRFFDYYQWVSVMDGRTSTICAERNGKIYEYGRGPLPPAHYRCRSKIVPVPTEEEGFEPPDLKDWLDDDNDLGLGEIKGDKYFPTRSLSLNGFIGKLGDILQ